jgi:FtsP/CotA-like multicopper oxidase with cupredoxin domain
MDRRKLLKLGFASGAAAATSAYTSKLWAIQGKGGSGGGVAEAGGGAKRGGGESSGGGPCVPGGNKHPDQTVPSPRTTPFISPMPRMQTPAWAKDQSGFTGRPCVSVGNDGQSPDDAIKRSNHQLYSRLEPSRFLELWEKEIQFDFTGGTGELPKSPAWAFNGQVPGPLLKSHYGAPELVRIHNALPIKSDLGFGIPSTTTHYHNGHTASESDGFPGDFINPGQFHDHHYPNVLPGFTIDGKGDPAETLGTLWYHDHRLDFTAQNTYAGLIGMHLLYDAKDCDDETNGNGFQLPSGNYDVPIMFFDKLFDPRTGLLTFDLSNLDGMLGDKMCANGVIQPYFEVEARKYRFRMLGVGPSRWWDFHMSDNSPFIQIGEDGNLFTKPVVMPSLRLGVAERADVIVDFSKYKPGTVLYLQNRAEQTNGRGPTGNTLCPGDPIIQFRVIPSAKADVSRIPLFMRAQPLINLRDAVKQRSWIFDRFRGGWSVNGNFFDINRVDAHVKRNTAEIWTIRNSGGGWSHPIHIHFEEFRIISRNGFAPPPNETGRKDVIKLHPNESVTFFMRFRDWTGRYPMHCHNTVHEDHAMMIRWDLEP